MGFYTTRVDVKFYITTSCTWHWDLVIKAASKEDAETTFDNYMKKQLFPTKYDTYTKVGNKHVFLCGKTEFRYQLHSPEKTTKSELKQKLFDECVVPSTFLPV